MSATNQEKVIGGYCTSCQREVYGDRDDCPVCSFPLITPVPKSDFDRLKALAEDVVMLHHIPNRSGLGAAIERLERFLKDLD